MTLHGRGDPGHGSGPPRYPGTFLLAFREAIEGMGWKVRRWMGAMVECSDADDRAHVIGLENLYRRARTIDRGEWPALVAEFLASARAAEQSTELPADLATVASQLLVRLGPPVKLPAGGDAKVWAQPLAGTPLALNLVIDYPDRMCYVTEQLVTDSGRPATEWVDKALANLADRTPADCFQVVDEETGMRMCAVADAYDSSRALLLDRLLGGDGDGYFVALPARDQLLVLPVNKDGLAHVPLLKALAEKSYQNTPYAISGDVFWVHGDAWHLFPIRIQGERVTVEPPVAFHPVLDRLMPEERRAESDRADEQPLG
jgi:hypothetical protein